VDVDVDLIGWVGVGLGILYNMPKPRGDVEISSSFCVFLLS